MLQLKCAENIVQCHNKMLIARSQMTQILCEKLAPPRLVQHQLDKINHRLEKAAKHAKHEIVFNVPKEVFGFAMYDRHSLRDQLTTYLKTGGYDVRVKNEWDIHIGFAPSVDQLKLAPLICVHKAKKNFY